MSIRSLALSAALLLAAAPAGAQQFNDWMSPHSAYTVGADSRDQYGYGQYGDARRIAYDNGYRKGVERGEKAVRDRKPLDVEREKDYRNADSGYSRSYGDKNRYRDIFRNGFAEGYHTAYNQYAYNGGRYSPAPYGGWRGEVRPNGGYSTPRYPGNGGYGGYRNGTGYGYAASYAFQNGVNDGYQKGRDDAQDGKYPDYARQKWYRSGDRHYDSQYGSRQVYEDQYRSGFREGYERAYRELRPY
jgi:hypothetical protein